MSFLQTFNKFGMACSHVHSKDEFIPLSTRLFPKFQGADAYRLSGIAARCDWVVLSDRKEPFVASRLNTEVENVQTVFVSLRSHEVALEYFFSSVLPRLKRKFVLVTGSEDITLPNQTDKRWPSLPANLRERIVHLVEHPLLLHWFCENLDEQFHAKISPLPLGIVEPDVDKDMKVRASDWGGLATRAKRILCAHRVRDGEQWQLRKHVTELARTHWRSFVTILDEPVEEEEFYALLRTHAFVLCVEGGGLDPSPKAWQSLLNGAVPILRTTATTMGYDKLPVVKIAEWSKEALTLQKLEKWHDYYFHRGYMVNNKNQILTRLKLDYWWNLITEPIKYS